MNGKRRTFSSTAALVLGLLRFVSGCCEVPAPNGEYAGFISDYHDHSKMRNLADTEIGAVSLSFDGGGSGKISAVKDGKPFVTDFYWKQEGGKITVNFPDRTQTLVMNGADELVFTDREFRIRCVFIRKRDIKTASGKKPDAVRNQR